MLRGPPGLPGNIRRCEWLKPSLVSSAAKRSRSSFSLPAWVVLWSTGFIKNARSRRGVAEQGVLHALVRVTSARLSSQSGDNLDLDHEERAQFSLLIEEPTMLGKLFEDALASWILSGAFELAGWLSGCQ